VSEQGLGNHEYSSLYKIDAQMSEITDPVLLVVYAHLVMERELHIYIEMNISRPSFLGKNRFSFSETLNLARALYSLDDQEPVWAAINALNNIRNAAAHNAPAGKFERELKEFTRWYTAEFSEDESGKELDKLRRILTVLLGFMRRLNSLEER
jgi:hypothetical protein